MTNRISAHIPSIAFGLVITLIAFSPLLPWLIDYTGQNKQLLHSFMVLAFAGAMLLYEKRQNIHLNIGLNRQTALGLIASNILIAAAYFSSHSTLYLAALVPAIYAWLHYLFGARYSRIFTGLLTAFALFLILLITFRAIDWPLRFLAGYTALFIFQNLGSESHLFLTRIAESTEGPMLIITMDEHPFHVAPECNGFGILSAGLLLAILVSVYQKPGWLRSAGYWLSTILLAFLINTTRIFIIMSLAPMVGDHYFIMHEIVGVSLFWAGVFAVWTLGMSVFKRPTTVNPAP